jgi:signal transduction histidine kinase
VGFPVPANARNVEHRILRADGTGEGLSAEKLAQLFQPFNRLGRESGPLLGTGIGLVMSKRLVELMGGTIGVESEVGVGSVFWFELKWTPAEQAASQ